MVAIRTCICLHFHKDGSNGSVFLSADLNVDSHWMAGTVGIEFFGSGISVIYRFTCNPGTIGCKIFNQNILLAAISSSNSFLYYMDLVFRNLAYPAYDSSYMVRNLGGCVYYKSSAFHCGITDMGLQRSMLDLACLVSGLNNGISLFKALFNVSDLALVGCCKVSSYIGMERELVHNLSFPFILMSFVVFLKIVWSAGSIFHHSVMDQRSAFSHGIFYSVYTLQRFIFHFY